MEQENWGIKVSDDANKEDIGQEAQHWQRRSIYKLPAYVTVLNKKAYKPHAVSFGPYHYGQPELMPMEEHKHRAFIHFLKRSHKLLQDYLSSLRDMEQDLKDSYDSLDPTWQRDTDRFLQLMVFDGCFMLEILRVATQTIHAHAYAHKDPIFSEHGKLHIIPIIRRDMLMIENQLPMMLLQRLAAVGCEEAKQDDDFIKKLVLRFYAPELQFQFDTSMGECLHVLDVYRKILIWRPDKNNKRSPAERKAPTHEGRRGDEIIGSATELNEAGIRLRKSKTRSLKDISFRSGVLRLPPIVVDDVTESMFLNLMAFERLHVGAGNEVTSYICFMDSIIDSDSDVSLLRSHGIIQNAVGSDKAAANLFNTLAQDITSESSELDLVQQKVNNYCNKPWIKWRAIVVHAYFTKPLAILTVIAAIFLFALTIAQTIYTVYPYYHPPEK